VASIRGHQGSRSDAESIAPSVGAQHSSRTGPNDVERLMEVPPSIRAAVLELRCMLGAATPQTRADKAEYGCDRCANHRSQPPGHGQLTQ
jgi:hypothetical protein